MLWSGFGVDTIQGRLGGVFITFFKCYHWQVSFYDRGHVDFPDWQVGTYMDEMCPKTSFFENLENYMCLEMKRWNHRRIKIQFLLWELSPNFFALSVAKYGCFDVQFLGFFKPTQIANISHRNRYISAIDRVKNSIEAPWKAQFLIFLLGLSSSFVTLQGA